MNLTKVKKLWINSVIKKNLKDVLSLYAKNATFKGTLMTKPTQGKENIKKYFKNFAPIVNDIKFKPNEITIKSDNTVNEMGNYIFYTKNGIIEAQYNFVFCIKNNEVKILSHFSSLYIK